MNYVSALVKACEVGNLSEVKRYLAQGANVNFSRQPFGWTPLTAALFNNKNQVKQGCLTPHSSLII